jgi:hypothetical protein
LNVLLKLFDDGNVCHGVSEIPNVKYLKGNKGMIEILLMEKE